MYTMRGLETAEVADDWSCLQRGLLLVGHSPSGAALRSPLWTLRDSALIPPKAEQRGRRVGG